MLTESRKSVEQLLTELRGRQEVYRLVRFESFKVEPFQDGIRIQGTDGSRRQQIEMDGPKFFQFAGVPELIQKKLTRNLVATVAQELLHIDKAGKFSVLMDQNGPICFQSFSAPLVPPYQVVTKLLEAHPGVWTVYDSHTAPEHVDFDLVQESATVEPKVGDVLALGLHLSLYDSMYRPSVVEGFTRRLICDNGATVKYSNRGYSVHAEASSAAVVEQIAGRAARVLASLPSRVVQEAFQLLATPVANPAATINRLVEELALPARYNPEARVHEAYAQEPGHTMWEVFNAFSRAAQTLGSYDARASLRVHAGKVLELGSQARCAACAHRL